MIEENYTNEVKKITFGVFFVLPDDVAFLGCDVMDSCDVILVEGKEAKDSCVRPKDDVICPCCDVIGVDVSETISMSSSLSSSMTSLSSVAMLSQTWKNILNFYDQIH